MQKIELFESKKICTVWNKQDENGFTQNHISINPSHPFLIHAWGGTGKEGLSPVAQIEG